MTVVGFYGLAVAGAAGVHSPFFKHPEGWYFIGDPGAPIPMESRCTEADLPELQERGTVCLTTKTWPRTPGGVLLYAHSAFIYPGEGLFDLHDRLDGLENDEKIDCHITYVPREVALEKMGEWSRQLHRDAYHHIQHGRAAWERALDSAERARVVAPPPEHALLQIEAFVLIGAAWILLGRDFEDIVWDAESERNPGLLQALKARAPLLAKRIEWICSRRATGDPRVLLVGGKKAA